MPDYSEKFDLVVAALDSLKKGLMDSEKDLAEKVAGVSAAIEGLIKSVEAGDQSAASALEGIIKKLDELKAYIAGLGQEEEDEYVDLGLTVKWATRNLGAAKSTDPGFTYAWGEINPKADPKSEQSWSNYKWMTSGKAIPQYITKYQINDRLSGAIWYDRYGRFRGDGKTVLESEDDAATAKLGSPWRMPTNAEFKELITKCTRRYTVRNGVKGLLLTGDNGNSIFLPTVNPVGSNVDEDQSCIGLLHFTCLIRRMSCSFWG